ncbi:MAG TPA: Matrixin, partial [Cytophagales bacterium]|nr:Matrixin [Cytophagales bacterium]
REQFITELVLHEMGHTMGLNHNMKSSHMLSPAELKDKSITRKYGVIGSVMDYSQVNFSSDKSQQGDYYTTKTGPYDHWAIEFGYTPFPPEKEKEGLAKILSRSTDPKLIFGNDADITYPGSGVDPRVMVWDMSSDMVTYAEDRFKTVNKAMDKLKDRFVKQGQSYEDLRNRYFALVNQRFSMARGVGNYIGGIYVDRSFPEQQSGNKPLTPVPAAYQKSAMKVLSTYVFSPKAFEADAQMFPYLQRQRRGFNFFGNPEDPKILRNVSSLQKMVLYFILHPVTLSRATTTTLYGNTYTAADITSDLVKASFSEDIATSVNTYRQNLQTDLVQMLIDVTNDANKQYDPSARAAAYYSLTSIKSMLVGATAGDTQTKAHRSNLKYMIDKGLSTSR